MKDINKGDCHYYQFTCSGREGPQIQVSAGSIRYKVQDVTNNQNGTVLISNAIVYASVNPVLISVGIHQDTRTYRLFIRGSSLQSSYQVSPLNANILSVYKKIDEGLPFSDLDGCVHQTW